MKKKIALLAGLSLCILAGVQIYNAYQQVMIQQATGIPQFGSVIGNPQGSVTISEFVDYKCPHCPILNERLMQALASEKDVRIVVRVVPWLDQESEKIARLAVAAGFQKKDILFHNAAMATGGLKSYTEALGIAQEIGVDMAKAGIDMSKPEIDAPLHQNIAFAKALKLDRVPALLINGHVVFGTAEAPLPTVNQLRILINDAKGKTTP